jgi:uncharacterized protein (TIGR02171 family)
MKIRIHFVLFGLLLFMSMVLFCSPDMLATNQPDPHPGMRKINAEGKTFMQGADDSAANADEKPRISSGFSYDYWIDTELVTQKEYLDVTGKQPVRDTSPYGRGDGYPVYYVSRFDAVLFCNAKSKMEKLDTVYSYSGAPQTLQGSVYGLVDVHLHYERSGYRLPTESEWEFAAREGTSSLPFPHLADSAQAQSYAWYSANSSGRTHPVASLLSNAFGLYDMAGNVFEWTGDWKGFYHVPQITNSIGAAQPDNSNERVVKGGSFTTGFSSLRPSHRTAIYETSQSTAASYIGFRCAQGIIPSPSYLSQDSLHTTTNPTVLLVGSSIPFLGTPKARLVFVNVTKEIRTLCFVDFIKNYPLVYELKDYTSVYVPVISPNGKYVAFSTGDDGGRGSASIYIRNLDSLSAAPAKIPCDSAFEPRWWVDPASASKDTFCIFTNSAVDNASAQWLSTGTFMMKIAGGIPVGAVQQLVAGGGYHDGRSSNGRYMVTGYTRLMMRDMSSAQDRQLFVSPLNGKGPGGSTQVCNASICPDSLYNDRCLFLDFGCPGPTASTLTGTNYGVHEYLFIGEYSGTVLSWFRRPDGEASWDYPEWSTAGKFAVACARDGRDDSHAIYFVNLRDSSYCRVIDGTELAHPFLWVNNQEVINDDSLDLDSLGNYNDPPLAANLGEFTRRMHDFWRKHDEMQIVFVGSSHTENDIDPRFFSGTPVYNMGFGGSGFFIWVSIIENYLVNHCPGLEFVGCDVVPGLMNWPGYFTSWPNLDPNKGYNYDVHHRFWKNGLPKKFENLVVAAPCPDIPDMDTLGLFRLPCNNWGGTNPDEPDTTQLSWTIDEPTYKANFNVLKEVARFLANKKIHFCMYVTPENPYYRTTGSYGLYGPGRETGKAVMAQLRALQDSFPSYVHFYDGNLDGYHDYVDSEAFNADHLCLAGARKFSARMDSVVHAILGH